MTETPNIEQEIAQLEQQIAEKRASLETGDKSSESVPGDKEILRETVHEKIKQHTPAYQPVQPPASSGAHDDQSYNDPALVDKVQELVNMAFTKGLDDAVKSAVQTKNPALIDAFHDVLVDQLYDTLVERGKLEPVK